jgi:Mg-chelatase subunit ChlD
LGFNHMRQRVRTASRVGMVAALLAAVAAPAARAAPPASVVLTLDTSGSVGAAQLTGARDLALAIMAALPESSEFAVLAFDDQSRVIVPWTSRPDEVRAKLTDVRVGGRYTALHDALYDASRYVRDASGARKAIVLITDGVDENSALNLEDGLRVATDGQIPVYAIGVGARPQERILRRIAKLTSGDYVPFDRARGADLAAAIAGLAPAAPVSPSSAAFAGEAPSRPAAKASAAAVSRSDPARAPAPPTPRYIWLAVALTGLAAATVIVLAWRQRQTAGACRTCGRPLPGGSSSCAFCGEFPTKMPNREPARIPGRAASERPAAESEPDLSATVLARIDSTEEYLERTITLEERPVLAITRGPGMGQVFALSETSATSIGRSRANDIQVEDVSISGQHCRVRPEDGRFVVHDLRSTNGTLVNEKKVSRHVLEEGDVIGIGETSLQFRREMKRN